MVAKRTSIKVKEGENLSDSNIEKVINLLEHAAPITKKAACEILHISYNLSRLANIIETHKHKKEQEIKYRAANRGKPPTGYEIQSIIEDYLKGDGITVIAKRLYRPDYFVKNIIIAYNVPIRIPGGSYFVDVPIIPDEAVKELFTVNEKVFAARYQSMAVITGSFVDMVGQLVYRIYLLDERLQHYALQPYWELASLEHLNQYGIKI